MQLHILAVGDVVSRSGVSCLRRQLPGLRRLHGVHFTVVNGENAAGVGLTAEDGEDIFSAGADVITLGNHTWSKMKITRFLEDNRYILRPANFPQRLPGRGWGVYEGPMGLRIGVVNLIGRVEMDPNVDNPFTVADSLLPKMEADVVLVDFHAEATSEKLAMGWYLDGRAAALWGTHTHVPTADCRVLPKGTGYVTDLGMTGPRDSVIGIQPQISINKFLGGLPRRYEPAPGPCQLNAVLFTVDSETHACVSVERVDVWN
ncbi:MAG: TIGR00282 family metallophosphoesterase [Clostridiales bacterium]|nr:TIGR00282 family metallophosphoesterase [Clostridiales bacterium]